MSIRKKMQDTYLIREAQPFFLEVRHPFTRPGTSRKSVSRAPGIRSGQVYPGPGAPPPAQRSLWTHFYNGGQGKISFEERFCFVAWVCLKDTVRTQKHSLRATRGQRGHPAKPCAGDW